MLLDPAKTGRLKMAIAQAFAGAPSGVMTTDDVCTKVNGTSREVIRNVLGRLVRQGVVRRIHQGKFQLNNGTIVEVPA
jgi:predicted transcriptional regulator of viral defense system